MIGASTSVGTFSGMKMRLSGQPCRKAYDPLALEIVDFALPLEVERIFGRWSSAVDSAAPDGVSRT